MIYYRERIQIKIIQYMKGRVQEGIKQSCRLSFPEG
jgi:hypothetical protein